MYSYNNPIINTNINTIKIHIPRPLSIKNGTGSIREISTSKIINKIEIKKKR